MLTLLAVLACTPAPSTLWVGGDLFYGREDPARLLAPLAPLTADAVGMVNLEGSADPFPEAEPAFSAPSADTYRLRNEPLGLLALRRLGVAGVGTENNHRGDAADPVETDRRVSVAGMWPLGTAVVPVGDASVALTQVDLSGGVPASLDQTLETARKRGDVLVVGYHVTGPPSYLPRPELRTAVDRARAAGAALVVAHGTHAVGPVEVLGETVVAWGLGNLAMACDCTTQTDAVLLRAPVSQAGLGPVEVVPIKAGVNGAPAEPAPDPAAILDLLDSVGSRGLERRGDRAVVTPL